MNAIMIKVKKMDRIGRGSVCAMLLLKFSVTRSNRLTMRDMSPFASSSMNEGNFASLVNCAAFWDSRFKRSLSLDRVSFM